MKKVEIANKFYRSFADQRLLSKDLVPKIVAFLKEYKIPHKVIYEDREAHNTLLTQFFGKGFILCVGNRNTNLCIVGKGVCFDSGGYNIKPSGMEGMWHDKTGALLAIAAAIQNNSYARVFFVDNLVDKTTILPGSILTESLSNKKIVINNTDAEGRIGLAYLLSHCNKDKIKNVITVATLTGISIHALGKQTFAAVHTNQKRNFVPLLEMSLKKGLQIWPLPTHKSYDKCIQSSLKGVDLDNLGSSRYAGSQTAFSFLKEFYKGNLIHVDMAAMDSKRNGENALWGQRELRELINFVRG